MGIRRKILTVDCWVDEDDDFNFGLPINSWVCGPLMRRFAPKVMRGLPPNGQKKKVKLTQLAKGIKLERID